jgi:hypothetical protein
MSGHLDAERILGAFLAPEADRLPDRVLDAALEDIARTPQRSSPGVPWRFPHMRAFSGAAGITLVALVAMVGAGGLIYLTSKTPSGPGGPTAHTAAPTPAASEVAPGISTWRTYTSAVHGFTLGYPEDWSVNAPATREWHSGDELFGDVSPYADTFVSPGEGDASIGVFVWEMPRGDGADWFTVEGLKAWADTFCNDVAASACDTFTQAAVPMCLALVIDPGEVECDAALLVPTADAQYAFFGDRGSLLFADIPDRVTVVVLARNDGFPPAARYGGSVELLKSILTTMDVWTPGQIPVPYPGAVDWEPTATP